MTHTWRESHITYAQTWITHVIQKSPEQQHAAACRSGVPKREGVGSPVTKGFHLKTNDLSFKNDVFLLAKTIQPMWGHTFPPFRPISCDFLHTFPSFPLFSIIQSFLVANESFFYVCLIG